MLSLLCVKCAELYQACWLFTGGGSLRVARIVWRLSGKLSHNIFLSHYTLGKRVVGDIINNQIPVSRWLRVLRRCIVVCCIALEKFAYALWLIALLLFWYICTHGFLPSPVVQWCAYILHPRSPIFWETWRQCICDVFWESILISIGFQSSDGRYILIRCDAPLIFTFQCVVLVKTYFPLIFSKVLCKQLYS